LNRPKEYLTYKRFHQHSIDQQTFYSSFHCTLILPVQSFVVESLVGQLVYILHKSSLMVLTHSTIRESF
jgi:hypothetical protein